MTYVPCDTCPGEIIVGQYEPIRVPLADDEGFPVLDNSGRVQMVTYRLPAHRARFIGQSADPELTLPDGTVRPSRWGPQPEAEHSVFDPTGLVPALCDHGLTEHPAGHRLRYGGKSWIRSKYINHQATCPVDLGLPAPADLTTPRVPAS